MNKMTTYATEQNFKVNIPTGPLSIDLGLEVAPSEPLKKSLSPEGTIGHLIEPAQYSEEQHKTWESILQMRGNIMQYDHSLCQEYKEGFKKLEFPKDRVSNLGEMSEKLKALCDWQLMRVDGFVSPEVFFKLLANKIFPCTDIIRNTTEKDFTALPDTFHDQVGHLPMIVHPRFSSFFHLFGLAGTNIRNAEELEWFTRIYWFTAESGLINPTRNPAHVYDAFSAKVYGASIASSYGETLYALSPEVKKYKFDIDHIIKTDFDVSVMQKRLFEIESFDKLEQDFHAWAIKNQFLSV